MNIRRILISEQEKKQILSLYGKEGVFLNEAKTYTLVNNTTLSRVTPGGGYGTTPYNLYIKKGAVIRKDSANNIIIPKESTYYKEEGKEKQVGIDGKLSCKGVGFIDFGVQSYKYQPKIPGTYDTFSETLQKALCTGTSSDGGTTNEVYYKTCEESGVYKKFCKDPKAVKGNPDVNGTIYKLQGCLGIFQDGFFGGKTETALLAKTGKKSITRDEIVVICNTQVGETIGDGSWKEKFPCIEASLQNGKLEKLDDFVKCGCFHLKDGSCIIYTDGTAWCEGTDPSKGSIYYFECFQNEIIIKKEKPIQDNVEKPNKPISGGEEEGGQLPDFKPPFIQKPPKPLD